MDVSPRVLEQIAAELERLGVRAHAGGRLRTYDAAGGLSDRDVLARLRALPDGAGIAAVNAALLAPPGGGRPRAGEADA